MSNDVKLVSVFFDRNKPESMQQAMTNLCVELLKKGFMTHQPGESVSLDMLSLHVATSDSLYIKPPI